MSKKMIAVGLALMALLFSGIAPAQRADRLRNVERGTAVPEFELATLEGEVLESKSLLGKVVILVYLSAEQRSSERAATDAHRLLKKLPEDSVRLIYVTADVVHRGYFEEFRKEAGIQAPLALDAARELYSKLGLIVFPTTLVTDSEGKLAHVIATRRPSYPSALEACVRHALGELDDAELAEHLTASSFNRGSPRSKSARHRSAARLLREKGLLEGAEKELKTALEHDPEGLDVRLDLVDLLIAMQRIPEADELSSEVLKENPRHRRARLMRGIVLYRTERLDEAQTILENALELNPDPARAHYYLGRIHEARGNKDEALEHYREVIERLLKE